MKRVLLIAYYFPPGGGAGVQRTVGFARHLSRHGWEPTVIAPPVATRSVWSPEDASLGKALDGVRIHRVAEPASIGERSGWWHRHVVAAALRLGPFDAVFATMSPWDSGEAARDVSARSGVPWIADLRDPWALDELQAYRSAWHRRRELGRMGQLLATAGAVVMNTDEARIRLLATFPALRTTRVQTIANGYDEADFAGVPPGRDDDTFRIVHSGHLWTELAQRGVVDTSLRPLLGGRMRGVNVLTRSHVYLMRAVERVLELRPDLAPRIEIVLAGGLTDADRQAITLPCVTTLGYIAHARSVELVRSADLLFLPLHDLPAGRRATVVPGKTYEYLASGRPILAALPDGDARDLLGRFDRVTLVRPDDVEAMTRAIIRLADLPPAPTAPRAGLEEYERADQAIRLAALLDAVSDRQPQTHAA